MSHISFETKIGKGMKSMQLLILVTIVGLLGGVAVGLQGPLSSLMSQHIGALESIFIIHIGGAILSLIPLLMMGGGNLGQWRSVPWYALGAGALGLVVLGGMIFMIPRVGVAAAVTLVVAGQLVVSAILDHYGLLGASVRHLDLSRAFGLLIVFAGVWLTVR
jgi:transporter family-2 protein